MSKTLDQYIKDPHTPTTELCGCGCTQSLEKNDPAGPHFMFINNEYVRVNSDCHYEAISKLIDQHPVGALSTYGPASIIVDNKFPRSGSGSGCSD